MKFESIKIKNFRNFKNIEINIDNRNVFFGLNDVGKTNFLYALRFVFDKNIRKNGFVDSDYYQKQIDENIEIIIKINIQEEDCDDNNKLRARLRGALRSEDTHVYIKIIAEFDKKESLGIPHLFWGGNLERLEEIKMRGYLTELDSIFNVFYIDAYVDVFVLFKKHLNDLIHNQNENDDAVNEKINKTIEDLNKNIAKLSGIKTFEKNITPKYKVYKDENVSIELKSEIAIKGLYSNLVPYIKNDKNDKTYPTAGEGRKKLLMYSIFDMIAEREEESKINLFLIEEPENHLHKSLQIVISNVLFKNNKYKYLFVTTHSPYILYEMDEINLVRIYNKECIDTASVFYEVPEQYSRYKKVLNRRLSEAIFSNKVLLVEGPSEIILFEKILSIIDPFYESKGKCIIDVGGVAFEDYANILKKLNIDVIIKTDNDLQIVKKTSKYNVLGFRRCNKLSGEDVLPKDKIDALDKDDENAKRNLFDQNIDKIIYINETYKIYLSRVNLEYDLDELMHDRLVKLLKEEEPVKYLQTAKANNMQELVFKLSNRDCKKIFEDSNFSCLKEVLK